MHRRTRAGVSSLCLALTLASVRPGPARADQGDTPKVSERHGFVDWFWEDQIRPTIETAFDRDGLMILGSGVAATVMSHQFDHEMRENWRDRQRMSTSLVHTGVGWSSGFAGVAIAATQIVFDREAGLLHARALALTSASHISIALVSHRRRPDRDEYISFPSGHLSSAFATATALSYSYGWIAGVPAFGLAFLSAGSRLSDDAHWLSDLVAGAALGLFWGRASGEAKTTTHWAPYFFDDGAGLKLTYSF